VAPAAIGRPLREAIYAGMAGPAYETPAEVRLLRTLGPVGTTSQAYLRVPIGVLLGVVFLGETLAPTTLIGLLCVIAGVAAMTLPSRAH